MIFGCFLLVVSFLLYGETKNFFARPGLTATPALWPQIILALLAILSVALIIVSLKAYQKEIKENKAKGIHAKINISALLASINKKVVAGLTATVAFILVFRPLGFAITSLIYFMVITMILEPTKDVKTIVFRVIQSLVLVVLIYLVFVRGLKVQLPLGPFPSHWFF